MNTSRSFRSPFAPYLDRFVSLKRAVGLQYNSARNMLLAFDRYIDAHAPETPLRQETLIQYLISLQRLSPRARDNAVGVVWAALAYAHSHGALIESLPERPAPSPQFWRQRQPRIVSATEIGDILAATRDLPPKGSLRPATMATLLGLLYTTGIRIGEALALDVGDFDCRDRILTIRHGKFGKSRALVLRESVADALRCYVENPLRRVRKNAATPIFISGGLRRLSYSTVRHAAHAVYVQAGLTEPYPRLHDYRHTFAVNRVAGWYAEDRDVNALLPALSTYLGHISVENTRLYLTANAVLLEHASVRFSEFTSALDEVLS